MFGMVFLQSTILNGLVFGATPDLALIILIFCANNDGSFSGQTEGFFSGLLEDLITSSPLGFHSFVRTLTGFVYGLARGKIFIDAVLFPFLMGLTATIFKGILSFILVAVFMRDAGLKVFTTTFLIEAGANALFAPLIYFLLKITRVIDIYRKDRLL
jgi:rod shape-determining protein MreD